MANFQTSSTFPPDDWRIAWANGECPLCSGRYKGALGVRVHISNSHPQHSQELKLLRREKNSSHGRPADKAPRQELSSMDSHDNSIPFAQDSETSPPSLEHWKSLFSELLSRAPEDPITSEFETAINNFIDFLNTSLHKLKGPEHPSTKFYRLRRLKQQNRGHTKYNHSSNPERSRKRRRDKHHAQYQYELAQFRYYNMRKQAVRSILNPNGKGSCKINVEELENYFRSILAQPNEAERDHYDLAENTQSEASNDQFSTQEVEDAMSGMSTDTSPGPDGVFIRVVKSLKCESVIALIISIMYQRSLVPSSFRSGKMVLVPKEGDPKQLNNWRPITIFSVLRRIVERVLDRRLRRLVQFSPLQSGFVNVPGAHVNASIINGVLRNAKLKKDNCTVVFLDVSKAFDNIGHHHLRKTLHSLPIPQKLRDLISELVEDNSVQIHSDGKLSGSIKIKRGVPQGGPLSPSLFNLSIDFILRELNEESVASECGYTLLEKLAVVVALAFADDIALVAKNKESAIRLIELAMHGLKIIGLDVNMAKSKAIIIENGKLTHLPEGLVLLNGNSITTLNDSDRVRYLGVDFHDEIVLDSFRVLKDLKTKLDLLINSPLLHPNQKLNIINQFIWPTLVYPLQTAPLHKIKRGFLGDVDSLIRGAVKQICRIPMDTPDSMLYSAHKFRGLGVFKASWEAFLQHLNITQKLDSLDNPLLQQSRNFRQEIDDCLRNLDLPTEELTSSDGDEPGSTNHLPTEELTSSGGDESGSTNRLPTEELASSGGDETGNKSNTFCVRALRQRLREQEFAKWCSLPSKGKGVEVYKEYPQANKWITEKCGLSDSEWTNAIKMTTNGCNLRSNPRTASNTFRCRHCDEFESLPHVLGACPRGELLRNARHNRVCDILAADLRNKGYEIRQEVHLASDKGSRFADIVAIDSSSSPTVGYVLDPTIRFETSILQAEEVNAEKQSVYEPTLTVLGKDHPSIRDWHVIGLMFGARGSLPKYTVETLRKVFNVQHQLLIKIATSILRDSLGILNHHIYSRDGGI